MKRIFQIALPLLALLPGLQAQSSIYINSTGVNAPAEGTIPQINATSWWNRAYFTVIPFSLPYEAFNNRFFTNNNDVPMYLDPGIRFRDRTATPGGSRWMDTWVNRGPIVTDHTTILSAFFGSVFAFDSRASILQVAATNIISKGPLASGTHGIIRLEGKRVDASFSTLRTGSSGSSNTFIGGFLFNPAVSNYVSDVGVRDLYWGVGNGDAVAAANSTTMSLVPGAGFPNFTEANPVSTLHEVIQPFTFGGGFFTNLTSVPSTFFFTGNDVFINTNQVQYRGAVSEARLSATNRLVQVVFYPVSVNDPSFTTDVRFYYPQGTNRPARATVGFHASEFDITTRSTTVNSVYLVDALATTTNSFLARNGSGGTRRPNTFSITRLPPGDYLRGIPGQPFPSNPTNNPLYGNFALTDVTNRYAAYATQVELLSASSSGSIPYDVTNAPGRVEIIGDEVNLDQTRIRAESAVIIKTQNLVSNNFAQVDAPLINFDARSVQPVFNIVNLAPTSVRRFGGTVRAWSATWNNFEPVTTGTNTSTNTVTFHVVIVESQLRSTVPVLVNEFAARATNVVLGDQLNITKSFVVEANSLHVTGGITLPPGQSLTASNLLNVRNFTNDGIINISSSAFYGTDRALSYSNWVNRGTNTAGVIEIRTRNFENSGALVTQRGVFSLDAVNATMFGKPLIVSNAVISFPTFDFLTETLITNIFTNTTTLQSAPVIMGSSDVDIRARDFLMSNAVISASTIILNITNRLADSGLEATNHWTTFSGLQTSRRPTTSSLFGTHLRAVGRDFQINETTWAGADMGNANAGFTNNLALGKVTFDGGLGSRFRFYANSANSNALYVDYIELVNSATNFNTAFTIAPNFTIYFANANVPATALHNAAGGRFKWVRSFAGPLSSTNITYPSGTNYTFNIALVTDNDIDSDGDGLVNSVDPLPIYTEESAILSVAMAAGPVPCVLLSWNALAYSSNYLEFKASASATQWNTLTNFHMGPFTWPVVVDDPISTNGEMRVYRLRVDPGPHY